MYEGRGAATTEYAGFWVRLIAHLIDGLLLTGIGYLVLELVQSQLASPEEGPIVEAALAISPATERAVTALVDNLLPLVYLVGFWTWRGQTPGKMVMGVKIVRTDGAPIGLGKSILRYLGYIVSGLILFIGYLWIGVDPKKQGVHDKIADTYVIKLRKRKASVTQFHG